MSITVPDPLGEWIDGQVESGHHASASDYVRELIRQDRDIARQGQLSIEDIRQSIETNLQEGTVAAEDVFDRIERKFLSRIPGE